MNTSPSPRGLRSRLESALRSVPVVVLEGGRAVGKTTLSWTMREAGHFVEVVDFSDVATREAAARDPDGFVDQLPLPVVIDEAQLVEPITLAVKRRVDRERAFGRFLLTGSSRIGRGALGGSDPLAGRAVHLRLHPFTQGERNEHPVDVMPWLREGGFEDQRIAGIGDIKSRLLFGGLPENPGVLAQPASPITHRSQLGSYVESVVHEVAAGSRVDRSRIIDVFRAVAGSSASILNIETLGRDLGISRPTVEKYLDFLESSFLLDRIPAFASDARREIRGHPRLVASDVALAGWAGRYSAESLNNNPTALGGLIHTMVANELMAQSSWSQGVLVRHWRHGNQEADLVLEFPDGILVGVEIKATRNPPRRDDVAGLRAFRKKAKGTSHCVVFYLGDQIFEIEQEIWALPIQTLWNPKFDAAGKEGKEFSSTPIPDLAPSPTAAIAVTEVPADSALFVSYVHDDDAAEGGRIVQLARDLAARYRFLTGEELEVFTDRDLRWGEQWRARLDQQLARTTFFVPVVTPRFLRSVECRREADTFMAAADSAGYQRLVLPIRYVELSKVDQEDPMSVKLAEFQWDDWTELRYEEVGSGIYKRRVDDLCRRLMEAVGDQRTNENDRIVNEESEDSVDTDDLEIFERLESVMLKIPGKMAHFESALDGALRSFTTAISDIEMVRSPASIRQFRFALRRVEEHVKQPIELLDVAVNELRAELAQLDQDFTALIRLQRDNSEQTPLWDLSDLLESLPRSLNLDRNELGAVRAQMTILGRTARELRGPVRSLQDAVLLASDVENMLERWHLAAN